MKGRKSEFSGSRSRGECPRAGIIPGGIYFYKTLTAVFESNFMDKGEVVDQIWMKDSWTGVLGRLILSDPLQLKESLRIRDGLGMPDTRLVPKPAYTPVTIKTSALGFLWICRN